MLNNYNFRCFILVLSFFCLGVVEKVNAQNGWINEIHYQNSGPEQEDFLEVALEDVTTFPINNWEVQLYNSQTGSYESSYSLSDFIKGTQYGSVTLFTIEEIFLPEDGLGIALAYDGQLVQFISYGGAITGVDGLATEIISANIGVFEDENTSSGHSLMLTGYGISYGQFTWGGPELSSKGLTNKDQILAVKDQTSTLLSRTAESIESNAIAPFEVLKFGLTDAGGDNLKTSLNRIVLEVKDQTIGLTSGGGHHLAEVLQNFKVVNTTTSANITPINIEFPDYQTVYLYFGDGDISVNEGSSEEFAIFAEVIPTYPIADNSTLSLQTRIQDFQTSASSSRLATSQTDFIGNALTFNIQATEFRFENVPDVVVADEYPTDGVEGGLPFSVTIKAVDAKGRLDEDVVDDLVVGIQNQLGDRTISGSSEDIYPEMVGGIATSSNLFYRSSNLPENFKLTVNGNIFPGDPVFESQDILANVSRDNNSIVEVDITSGSSNIQYADYQGVEVLTVDNSVKLGSFLFKDSPESGESDKLVTGISAIKLQISNPENLHSVAIFNGTTLLDVKAFPLPEDGIVVFEELNLSIPDNSSLTLDIRATFQEKVTDNTKISVGIYQVVASLSGSRFADEMPTDVIIGNNVEDDVNRLEVVATALHFVTVPSKAVEDFPFRVEVEATDALGNRDLDENSSVAFSKATGTGTLSPDGFTVPLVEGFLETQALQLNEGGTYSIKAEDVSGPAISSTTSTNFVVQALCSCEGLFISEVGHGSNSGSPKYLEITNASTNTYKLDNLEVRVYENGATTASQVIKLTPGTSLNPGGSYVISNTSFNASWSGGFTGKSPNQTHSGMIGNGNDVYELYNPFFNADEELNIIAKVLDIYGQKGVNGTGKDWEYTQKLVNRRSTVNTGNEGSFSMAEWTILSFSNELAKPGIAPLSDLTGPAFESATPASSTQDVVENSDFTFTFDEALNIENGKLHIRKKMDGALVASIDLLNTEQVSGEGTKTLTVKTGTILPGLTELYAEVDAGALTDLVGNAITGFSYEFKTTDTIKPVVLSLNPADNETRAVLHPVFRIEFSEPVERVAGSFKIFEQKGEDETLVGVTDILSEMVNQPQPNVIEFELTNDLLRLQNYYITAEEGILVDKGGNSFAGFTGKESWSFKTVDPYENNPKIVKRNPQDKEGYVLPTHQPKLSFNKPVVPGNGSVKLYNLVSGELLKTIQMESGEGFSITDNEVAFDFGTLQYNAAYLIRLEDSAIKDLEGRSMDKFHADSDWIFNTVENAEPVIAVVSQANPLYFGNVPVNTEKLILYQLGGRNLSQDLSLEIPEPFEISLDGGDTYKKGTIQLTPAELAGFLNVVVRFAPKVANAQLYQADLVHQSAEAETVRLGVLAREGGKPEIISIAEARALGVGAEVVLSGILTSGNSFGSNIRYMQDGTGAIAISSSANILAGFQQGDRVKVSGIISETNGKQVQIGGNTLQVTLLESGVSLPEAKQLYANQINESLESYLIQLQNLQFERAGEKFESGNMYKFTDTKGTEGMLMIEGSTNPLVNTTIPSVATVTGVLKQENTYYLLPRDLADVEVKEPLISLDYPDGKMNFGFVEAGKNSRLLRIIVNAQDLAEDILITVPAPFKVSANSVSFSESIRIPGNSGSRSIWMQFAPQEANRSIYREEVSFSSSSAADVKAVVSGVEGTKPELLSIAEARVMRLGEKVKVRGVLSTGTTVSFNERYLQDATAGIVAFLVGDQAFNELPLGAEIEVEGILRELDGLLQIANNPNWKLINGSAGVPQSLVLDPSGFNEINEARVVKVQNIQIDEGGTFKAGRKYEFLFSSGEKGLLQIPVGAHPLVGARIPYKATVTGVLSETAEGFVLIPRFVEDLEAADAVVHASFPEGDLKFLFVPAGSNQVKSFVVKGENLQGNISLNSNSPFEISTNKVSFGRSASITKENASEATVYVRFRPTLQGSGVSEDFVVLNTQNGRPVNVPVIGIEGSRPELLSISQARALGAGESVKVQGVLSSGSGWFAEKRFVQDETGGLLIVTSSGLANFESGDKVEVSGQLQNENNHLQIGGEVKVSLIQKAAGNPAARVVTAADQLNENNESELLSIKNVRFKNTGYFEKGKPYLILLETGEEATLRISGDENSLIGKLIPESANVTGLLVQKADKYEMWPRNESDLSVISNPKAIILAVAENGFDFGLVQAGSASYVEQYTLTVQSISGKISVSVEAPFQLSIDGSSWTQDLEIAGTSVNTPLYARFNPAEGSSRVFYAEIYHKADGLESRLPVMGRAGAVSTEVFGPDFVENFEQCFDLNTFTRYDADGVEQWSCAEGAGVENSGAVGIHHVNSEAEANEDWLISPPIRITTGSRMAVDIARKNAGPDLQILVSTDFTGSGKPAGASWEPLEVTLPEAGSGLTNFGRIKDINLSAYAGKDIYVAFRYSSTYEEASVYILDNFSIQSLPIAGFVDLTSTTQEGNTIDVKLALSEGAKQDGTLTLRFNNGEGVIYGETADYTTTPAINSEGELVLDVAQGQQEVRFSLQLREDLLEEADEQLVVQVVGVAGGLLIDQEKHETSITFKSNNAQSMDIVTARGVDEQGGLLNQQTLVKLRGVVYGPNLSTKANGLEFRLIDHGSEGQNAITIAHSSSGAIPYSPKEGDELEVIGVLNNEEGLAVLVPQIVSVVNQGLPLKEPLQVSNLQEETESKLLAIEEVEVVSGWEANAGSAFNAVVKDVEGRQFTIQIRPGTDLFAAEKPTGKINLVGFGAQQDASQPFTEGYYLVATSKTDVEVPTAIKPDKESVALTIFPNPANNHFFIRSAESQRFERVQVIGYNGQMLLNNPYDEGKGIDTGKLENGMYLVKIILKGGNYTLSRLSIIR